MLSNKAFYDLLISNYKRSVFIFNDYDVFIKNTKKILGVAYVSRISSKMIQYIDKNQTVYYIIDKNGRSSVPKFIENIQNNIVSIAIDYESFIKEYEIITTPFFGKNNIIEKYNFNSKIDHIHENIYAGIYSLENISKYNIKHIIQVNIEQTYDVIGSDISHYKYSLHDNINYNNKTELNRAKKMIEQAIQTIDIIPKDENILIHCAAGINRTATIILAYLYNRYNLSFYDSIAFLASKRLIWPLSHYIRLYYDMNKNKDTSIFHIYNIGYEGGVEYMYCNHIYELIDLDKHTNYKINMIYSLPSNDINVNPLLIKDVENPSDDLCYSCIKKNPYSLKFIKKQTDKMQALAFGLNINVHKYIIDPSPLIITTILHNKPFYLKHIPNQTEDNIKLAVKNLSYSGEQNNNHKIGQYFQIKNDNIIKYCVFFTDKYMEFFPNLSDELYLELLEINPDIYKYIPDPTDEINLKYYNITRNFHQIRDPNMELREKAIRDCCDNLMYIRNPIFNECMIAVSYNGYAYNYINNEFIYDEKIITKALETCPYATRNKNLLHPSKEYILLLKKLNVSYSNLSISVQSRVARSPFFAEKWNYK